MDLTKIFSGMDKGPEAIQSNFEKINSAVGDKVASTSYPVTLVNGYTGDVKCRYWQFGSTSLTIVTGWIKAPGAIPANTDLEFATLPENGPTHLQSSYIYAPKANVIANVSAKKDFSGTIRLRYLTPAEIYSGANLVLTAVEVW
jgi:hypothetical protein